MTKDPLAVYACPQCTILSSQNTDGKAGQRQGQAEKAESEAELNYEAKGEQEEGQEERQENNVYAELDQVCNLLTA